MLYADYDFYLNEFFGRSVQDADYPRLALRASQYIDYITQGRAERSAGLEAVKMACCALAEQYQTIEEAEALARNSLASGASGGAEVQSETVGGWSRTYRSGGDSAQTAVQAAQAGRDVLLDTAHRYLAHTGLLYRGGGRCR